MSPSLTLFSQQSGQVLDLNYFVEWHSWLWKPAVRTVLGDPARFAGKNVLELGCGHGRMACLFGLLGANVTAVEMPGRSLDAARLEVRKWNLRQQVSLQYDDGNLAQLTANQWDFVFSKSVLVIVPELTEFLNSLATLLRENGRLLAVENMQRGTALRKTRTHALELIKTGHWASNCYAGFRGVTPTFMDTLQKTFDLVTYRESVRFSRFDRSQQEGSARLGSPSKLTPWRGSWTSDVP